MKSMLRTVFLGLAVAGCVPAWAQPQITSLGDNGFVNCVSDNGATLFGSLGGGAARWTVNGASVAVTSLDGAADVTGCSNDGAFAMGSVPNTAGLGGFPETAMLAARWSEGSGWVSLGLPTPNPDLGVAGAGDTGSDLTSPRAISADGRFIVGQCYIAPDYSFAFRPWVWDAAANGGAGEMTILPTSFNGERGRFRDGRALGVSADGSVIVGGEDPHVSGTTDGGRVVVWRRNAGTGTYDFSYLPDAFDPINNLPVFRTVDGFVVNDAGTVIAGTTFEFNAGTGYFDGPFLARWIWNVDSAGWDRQVIGAGLTLERSWYQEYPDCPLPESLSATAMSNDGGTIVGMVDQPTCGSFLRSAFIWNSADGEIRDLQDYLASLSTIGIGSFASPGTNLPPSLGSTPDLAPGGRFLAGYGSAIFSTPGPAWVVDLAGGGPCVPPFLTGNPQPVDFSRCSAFAMHAAAGGTPGLSYQWFKDGAPLFDGFTASGSEILGSYTARLEISRPNGADVGEYSCVVTGSCGDPVTTAAAVARVDPAVTPLANDTCDTATDVGEGDFEIDVCGALIDDVPYASCALLPTTADAWFRYTPTFTGEVRLETCGSSYDTVLTVLDGCFGNEIACNDDFQEGPTDCFFLNSRIGRLQVTEGVPLIIRLSSIDTYFFGMPVGRLAIHGAPAVALNDDCSNAEPVVAGVHAFDTREATIDGVSTCNPSSGRDVWYSFSAPSDGLLGVHTCGTAFGTVLSVHQTDGVCGGLELACNGYSGVEDCWGQSVIGDLPLSAGQSVLIRIAGDWSGAAGQGVFTVTFDPPGCPCDWNHADGLDSQDFFDFLDAFFNGDADFNGADGTDSQDYFDFLECFFSGCL